MLTVALLNTNGEDGPVFVVPPPRAMRAVIFQQDEPNRRSKTR